MRVLVTGGTGVVGDAGVRALLAHGHRVRLLARHASDDARAWPAPGDADAPGGPGSGVGIEAHDGDVTDPASVAGAARGCDVVLHLVGTVAEHPPEVTYERVNVEGTRHMVDEAARSGVPRFVYVSSLGADRGTSPYHQSKFAGELEAARFPGAWSVVRLANVYGPGDAVVSLLLRMVRALPALPLLGGGDIAFQPIWAEDCGEALARACERDDLAGAALDVAGDERTSMRDLLDRFARLTGRAPIRLPMPLPVARLGVKLADAAGVDLGINDSQLTMLAEGNTIEPPRENALTAVLGVTATPLDEGLRRLLDILPEQLPDDGLGALHHKRYWAEVTGPSEGAPALFRRFCERFHALTPAAMDLTAEPDTPTAVLELHE
ncbi:MAG TPA: NAD-dependent epimerase/dehydratase family protein, partial [Gemmatirosa sp.]